LTLFQSTAEELFATIAATEELLHEISAAGGASERDVFRLEKLSVACARLAYPNGLSLTNETHNLIAWCDHLNEPEIKAKFMIALNISPLASFL